MLISLLRFRIVLVSNLKTIKEVFSQAKTASRPELFLTTVRNNLLTDGRHTFLGESRVYLCICLWTVCEHVGV